MKNTILVTALVCLFAVNSYADFRVNVSYGDRYEYRRCNPITYYHCPQTTYYVEERRCVEVRRPKVIYVRPCEKREVVKSLFLFE